MCTRVCVCVCARELAGLAVFAVFQPRLSSLLLVSSRLSSSRLGDGHLCEATGSNGTQWTIRVGAYERAHTRSRQRVHTRVHTPSISRLIDAGEKRPTRTESIFLLLLLLSLSPSLHDGGLSISRPPRLYKSLLVRPTRENTRKYVFPPLKYRNDTSALLLVNSVVLRCY